MSGEDPDIDHVPVHRAVADRFKVRGMEDNTTCAICDGGFRKNVYFLPDGPDPWAWFNCGSLRVCIPCCKEVTREYRQQQKLERAAEIVLNLD